MNDHVPFIGCTCAAPTFRLHPDLFRMQAKGAKGDLGCSDFTVHFVFTAYGLYTYEPCHSKGTYEVLKASYVPIVLGVSFGTIKFGRLFSNQCWYFKASVCRWNAPSPMQYIYIINVMLWPTDKKLADILVVRYMKKLTNSCDLFVRAT